MRAPILLPLLFVVSALFWGCELDTEPTTCSPGESKTVGECTECTCSDSGKWLCTDEGCAETECTPGSHKDIDCNGCTCDESGQWLCTTAACVDTCESDADCFVGGCSGQLCTSDSGMASTCEWLDEYACYDESITSCGCFEGQCGWEQTEALSTCLESPPCLEGETKLDEDGCNSCTCSSEGQWLCTQRDCQALECETNADCFVGGCSGQLCTSGGSMDSTCEWLPEYACYDESITQCGCFEGQCGWEETEALAECLGLEPPCVNGETKPADDGCNSCECNEGVWLCTMRDCEELGCQSDADCFVGGCSGQLCTGIEGLASTCEWLPEYACYQQAHCACFEGQCGWDQTEALAECLGLEPPCVNGETKPADDGCNTCTCDDGGSWVCTEIACQ